MKQRTLILSCGALFFLGASFAQAQAPAPFGAVEDKSAMITPVETISTKKASSDVMETKNPYLDTYLSLQQQIAVLNKLLEREISIGEMVRNYKRMGVAYDPPRPDLSVCRSVPKNLSCAIAYPKEYADFLPPPAPMPIVPAVVISDLPQPITELSPELALKQLLWTDITCLGQSCRAVITPDAENSGARYSIKVGDVLPQGGVVESISAAGVFVSSGNKIVPLSPAPLTPFALTARTHSPS